MSTWIRCSVGLALALACLPASGCFGGPTGAAVAARSCGPDDFTADSSGLGGLNGSAEREIAAGTQRLRLLSARRHSLSRHNPERFRIESEMESLAQSRAALLGRQVVSNPDAIVRTGLDERTLAELPEAARACAETPVSVEGKVSALAEDGETGKTAVTLHEDDGHAYALHFRADEAADLLHGSRVELSGTSLPCTQTAAEASPLVVDSASVHALNLPGQAGSLGASAFGPQTTAVILISFTDEANPWTAAQGQNLVFDQVSGYIKEASTQQTWLVGQTYGPLPIAMSSATCDPDGLAAMAGAAAEAAGANLGQYTHYVYMFPQNSCAWLGLGTIGGVPSKAWINQSFTVHTVAHELGHNFGLYHSHSLECGTAASIGPASLCSRNEYGDVTDIMGNLVAGHYNAFQKERLGWLNYGASPTIHAVNADGAYAIDAYETQAADTKALKILKSVNGTTGARSYYYVEYRQPIGQDTEFSFLSSPTNLDTGVVVHTGSESSPDSSYLLSMNPAQSWYQAALNIGQLFTDPDTQATIALQTTGGGTASVAVSLGNFRPDCVHQAPTLSLAPADGAWVATGTSLVYTLSVQDNDSESCAAETYSIGLEAPAGWAAALGATALSTTPGNLVTTTVTLASSAVAAPGAYSFSLSGIPLDSPASAGSAIGYYLVPAPSGLTAAVLPDSLAYRAGGEMSVRIRAAMNGTDAAGAGYTLILTRPDGSMVTRSGVTGMDGSALQALKIADCAAPGHYTLTVQMNDAGATASDTRSFDLN